MVDDPRPILWCETCHAEVVTRPSGECPWCDRRLVERERRPRSTKMRGRAAQGLVDRRVRRRADGICSACNTKRARPGRPRCSTCERCKAPSTIIGHPDLDELRVAA